MKVLEAGLHDQEGAKILLQPLLGVFPRMAKVWVDRAYAGLKAWIQETFGWDLEVVTHGWTGVGKVWVAPGQRPPVIPSGFHVLPRRWVIERTFAWLGRNRRLAKDYEFVPGSEEAWIYLAMIRLMARRLAASG